MNETPYYQYDLELLRQTLNEVTHHSSKHGFEVHYAMKANNNSRVLSLIQSFGLGADCVSGNEISKAIKSGFSPSKIVFAGVGKTDTEIELAIASGIQCFNCESIQEIEVINQIASRMNYVADIALRINPNVDANTHQHITTGLEENKFGIGVGELNDALSVVERCADVRLVGMHFHIGSQILDMNVFRNLTNRINELNEWFEGQEYLLDIINVGGGLGIDYENPDLGLIPDFASYFDIFASRLKLRNNQKVHFELGRSIVGQCGSLVTSVIYTKRGISKNFVIVDAGMTELMRPALYQAQHKIENLSSVSGEYEVYDVVGPVCETADRFGKDIRLPKSNRGDQIAIRSAGAYGEVMASQYNLRQLNPSRYVVESSPVVC